MDFLSCCPGSGYGGGLALTARSLMWALFAPLRWGCYYFRSIRLRAGSAVEPAVAGSRQQQQRQWSQRRQPASKTADDGRRETDTDTERATERGRPSICGLLYTIDRLRNIAVLNENITMKQRTRRPGKYSRSVKQAPAAVVLFYLSR